MLCCLRVCELRARYAWRVLVRSSQLFSSSWWSAFWRCWTTLRPWVLRKKIPADIQEGGICQELHSTTPRPEPVDLSLKHCRRQFTSPETNKVVGSQTLAGPRKSPRTLRRDCVHVSAIYQTGSLFARPEVRSLGWNWTSASCHKLVVGFASCVKYMRYGMRNREIVSCARGLWLSKCECGLQAKESAAGCIGFPLVGLTPTTDSHSVSISDAEL